MCFDVDFIENDFNRKDDFDDSEWMLIDSMMLDLSICTKLRVLYV